MLTLALPLVVSTGSWSLMHFCDRLLLSWYSTDAMAASMPAGIFYFSLLCIPLGISSYVNTFVAQYHGAGRPERVGPAIGQGIRIGLLLMPFYLLLLPLAQPLFDLIGHDPVQRVYEVKYFKVVLWGSGAAIISESLTAYFTGRGKTPVVMIVNVTAVLLNVVLDWILIFGHFGLPEMGITGAAIATVAMQWCRVLFYILIIVLEKEERRRHNFVGGLMHFDGELFRRIIRFGGPNGIQFFVEIAGFTAFILLVGRIGDLAMKTTTLAFTINTFAFMPLLGMSIATATLVGQQLGRNMPERADRAVWTSFIMALGYIIVISLFYFFTPGLFLYLYKIHTNPAEFTAMSEVTVILLRFVAIYSVFDASMMIFAGALRGAGDTRFILLVNFVMAIWPTPVAALGMYYFGLGLYWCWTIMTIWVVMLGLIFLMRYLQGKWRTMRVIEAEAFGDGSGMASVAAEGTAVVADTL